MLSQSEAQTRLQNFLPEVTIKAWTVYLDFYLFRVEYSSESEKDFDPFFTVDNFTGEVRDFAVMPYISEIGKLKWNTL